MFCLLSLVTALSVTIVATQCSTRLSIDQSLVDAHIPGTVILVVNSTDILYEETFGHHSLLPLRLMDVNKSIFALASLSKTFIAVAVMQLVELNLVSLDMDINRYLSSPFERIFHPLYPSHSITLRQLLSHSASIKRNDQMESILTQHGDTALTPTGLADACYTYLNPNASNWLPYPPGSVTFYSNIGASLAALIVERITRIPYDKYVKDKILKPLGIDIRKAGFRLSDFPNIEDLVKHYTFNASRLDLLTESFPQLNFTRVGLSDWISIPFYGPSFYPANLLRISAHSLSIFLRMFINNGSPLLDPRSIATMRTVVSGVIPYENINSTSKNSSLPSTEYGLIWNWRTIGNRRFIGHTGNMPGVAHGMMINERDNTGVIILSNGDSTLNNDLSKKIYDTLTNIQVSLIHCFEI